MTAPMRLSAFTMNCVGHQSQGLWRHPRDRSADYTSIGHWVELARTLERGCFDTVFLADVLGVYDVYGGGPDAAVRTAAQVPVNDPMLVVPVMAAVTEHLGFGVTGITSFEPPYTFARRMSTLDHLTAGRVSWNIVTGYLDSAARAMGDGAQTAHDDRYDMADGVPRGRVPTVGGQLGGRRRRARPGDRGVRRPGQGARDRARRRALPRRRHPPVRTVAAADARAVPGRFVAARAALRRRPRRVRVRRRQRPRCDCGRGGPAPRGRRGGGA